jgi:hypothetical protein
MPKMPLVDPVNAVDAPYETVTPPCSPVVDPCRVESDLKDAPVTVTSSTALSLASALIRTGGKAKSRTKGGSLKGDGTSFSLTAQTIPFMKYRFPDNKPHKFVQTFEVLAGLTQSNTGFANTSVTPTSGYINQFSSFAAVFDQYQLELVEIWILPRHTNPLSVSSTGNVGLLYSVIDYDDGSALTTSLAFEQYENCVVSPSYEGQYRKFIPHVAVANYAGSFTGYSNVPANKIWIDCATTGTQFYGLKSGVSACDSTSDEQVFDYIIRMHVAFKNVR